MNVAAYIRVSTDRQADKGYSMPEQEERIKAYCKSKGWDLVKIYKDGGYTGSNMDRPDLQKLINEIEAYDIVLVNKLDRLSRSQKDTLYLIQDIFAPHGCNFVSMHESFDTTTPIGIAMVGILSAFAQLERSQIKERTQMGIKARKKKGLWHGGCCSPTGYDYIDGKLVPNDEADQVRLVFDMFLKGTSMRDISRYLNSHYTTRYTSWNRFDTVRNVLKNQLYIGMIGDYKGQHEPLIDVETFNQVQILLQEHKNGKKNPTATHLLTGMCYCGYCGSRVKTVTTIYKKCKKKYTYYRCACAETHTLDGLGNKCELKPKIEKDIDQMIFDEILKLKLENIKFEPKKKNLPDNSAELVKIEKQIKRLIDLYSICDDNDTPALAEKLKKLNKKKSELEKIMPTKIKIEKKHIISALSETKNILKNGSDKDKKRLAETLIDSVILYNDAVKIKWKF